MKYPLPAILLIVISSLAFHSAYSQQDTLSLNTMSLQDLLNVKVTTASKTLQEIDLAPATVIVVTKEQIRIRGYQSLLDILVDLPDTKVDDKIYSGQRNSLTIRGIQGQQNFFVLLDGVKISSPTNEALPIMENYPLNLAEQVEIVFGPASALYGADAVSGVINIITRKIPAGKDMLLRASSIAGTYGYTNSTLYMAKRLGERSDLVVSGQYCYDRQPDYSKVYSDDPLYNVDHYKTGTFNSIYGPMTPSEPVSSGYEAPTMAYNIYAALHLDDFTLSFFTNYTRTPTSWSNNTQNAVYNKDVYMGQSISALSASYKKNLNRFTASTIVTATRYNMDPESNYRNLYTLMEPAYKYSTSLSVKAEEQVDYALSRKFNLTGGISHERFATIPQSADLERPVNMNGNIQGSYLGTTQYYRPQGLPAQFYHINYYNNGAFFQAQYAPDPKFSFTLGARYDYNSRYGETFNPRLGMVYKASSSTTIKALYGSAYLAPPVSTAYVTYGSFITQDSGKTYSSSFLHLPNPNLGPVKSHTFELSVRQYLTHDLSMTLSGYYNTLSGLFAFADDNQSTHLYNNTFNGIPVDYIEVFINEGRERTYGGNLQLNLKHSIGDVFLSSYASLSYVNGARYDDPNAGDTDYETELPFIAPFMFRIGSDIQAGKFTCSPRLLLMGRQNLPGISDTSGNRVRLQTIAGYALLNISLRYEFRRLSVFANITNALDQRYRSVSFNMDLNKEDTELFYGQPQDPVRVMGGLSLNF